MGDNRKAWPATETGGKKATRAAARRTAGGRDMRLSSVCGSWFVSEGRQGVCGEKEV